MWVLVLFTLGVADPSHQLLGVFQTHEACLYAVDNLRKRADGEFPVNTTVFCVRTDKQK